MTATCLMPLRLRKGEANRRNAFISASMSCGIIVLLWLLALLPMPVMANTAALSWLNGQLQTDGGYARPDDIATPVQATAETLRTQQALSAANGNVANSLAFLDTVAGQPATEYLSRALIAHSEAGSPAARLPACWPAWRPTRTPTAVLAAHRGKTATPWTPPSPWKPWQKPTPAIPP